jgi:hypothetical protein
MSQRTRTAQWFERRILATLAKRQELPTDLFRNVEEEQNYKIAEYLISRTTRNLISAA